MTTLIHDVSHEIKRSLTLTGIVNAASELPSAL